MVLLVVSYEREKKSETDISFEIYAEIGFRIARKAKAIDRKSDILVAEIAPQFYSFNISRVN